MRHCPQRHHSVALLFMLVLLHLTNSHLNGNDDSDDPFKQLYDVLMTRHGLEGKAYDMNKSSPAIFDLSDFPFDDKTYPKLYKALAAFESLSQKKLETHSEIQRALLQRHLWKVFDATFPGRQQRLAALFPDKGFPAKRSFSKRREAARPKIAMLIRRLALTREQIKGLPNTFTATVESKQFATRHTSDDLFKPFLPSDLFMKNSEWVVLGDKQPGGARPTKPKIRHQHEIPADIHSTKFKWRSVFVPFMRAPGGRQKTIQSVEKFNRGEELPVGTQFALVEQAFLISDQGKLVLSPLVISVSLRAYVGVNKNRQNGKPRATQSVAEFLVRPRRLMKDDAVMKPLMPADYRYEAGSAQDLIGGTFDPFESSETMRPRLSNCVKCHGQANPRSVRKLGLRTARVGFLKESSMDAIRKASMSQKINDETWTTLRELWRSDSATDGR